MDLSQIVKAVWDKKKIRWSYLEILGKIITDKSGEKEHQRMARLTWAYLIMRTSFTETPNRGSWKFRKVHSEADYDQVEKYLVPIEALEPRNGRFKWVLRETLTYFYLHLRTEGENLIKYSLLGLELEPEEGLFHRYAALGYARQRGLVAAFRNYSSDKNVHLMAYHNQQAVKLTNNPEAMISLIYHSRNLQDAETEASYRDQVIATKNKAAIKSLAKTYLQWQDYSLAEMLCLARTPLCSSVLQLVYRKVFDFPGHPDLKLRAIIFASRHDWDRRNEIYRRGADFLIKGKVDLQYWLSIPAFYFTKENRDLRLAHSQSIMSLITKDPRSHFYQYQIRDVEGMIGQYLTT